MNGFTFPSPSRVIFGAGAVDGLGAVVADLQPDADNGRGVLLLSDKGVAATGLVARVAATLATSGLVVTVEDSVPPEPSDADLDALAARLAGVHARTIVAVGGGSVMDAAKVLSVLAVTGWSTARLAEQGVPRRGAPVVMVPTTAGTGAESTPNAIVLFPERNLKIGIVSPHFMPDRVILDPELTVGLPPRLTASTGVDAFCHLLECFISKRSNAMSDMMAREGMRLLYPSLPRAFRDGTDIEARSAVMLAAYLGGSCIASSGTTAIHALSYPLGGTYRIPHGTANAALLHPVMAYQKRAIAPRLAEAAAACGLPPSGNPSRDADAFVDSLRVLVAELGIPSSLAALGVPHDALGDLTEAAFGVRRLLDNNPVELSRADIRAIYESVR